MRILITAGPTREPIDPVRFISNYSTGEFGYALADSCLRRHHKVTLISGPTHLKPPKGARFFRIEKADELKKIVCENFHNCDCLIMNSAVCDYKPAKRAIQKIKSTKQTIRLTLVKNPDILSNITRKKHRQLIVGFSLETEGLLQNALKKLRQKRMDLIVGTLLTDSCSPFGKTPLTAVLIDKKSNIERFKDISKKRLAEIIINRIEKEVHI